MVRAGFEPFHDRPIASPTRWPFSHAASFLKGSTNFRVLLPNFLYAITEKWIQWLLTKVKQVRWSAHSETRIRIVSFFKIQTQLSDRWKINFNAIRHRLIQVLSDNPNLSCEKAIVKRFNKGWTGEEHCMLGELYLSRFWTSQSVSEDCFRYSAG